MIEIVKHEMKGSYFVRYIIPFVLYHAQSLFFNNNNNETSEQRDRNRAFKLKYVYCKKKNIYISMYKIQVHQG